MNYIALNDKTSEYFDAQYMRYNPKVYKAENDTVTCFNVSKSDTISNFLKRDYIQFNTGKGSLRFYAFFAVCNMGCCDVQMIERFLKPRLEGRDVSYDFDNPSRECRDKMRSALKGLTQQGLLLRHKFEPGTEEHETLVLYLPSQTGLLILKNAMQKEGVKEVFMPVMPPFRLLGKAVSAHVALGLCERLSRYDPIYRDGFFSTYKGGHLYLNNMVEVDYDEGSFLIGITDIFMEFGHNNYIKGDPERYFERKLMLLEQFNYYAKSLERIPRIILCVSDIAEINFFLGQLFRKKYSDALLSGMYFTTEAAFKKELDNKYLSVYQNDTGVYELAETDIF